MSFSETCSYCGATLREERGHVIYSRMIGVKIPEIYDGVLFWQCPDCGKAWHRWGQHWQRYGAAQPYIDKING